MRSGLAAFLEVLWYIERVAATSDIRLEGVEDVAGPWSSLSAIESAVRDNSPPQLNVNVIAIMRQIIVFSEAQESLSRPGPEGYRSL